MSEPLISIKSILLTVLAVSTMAAIASTIGTATAHGGVYTYEACDRTWHSAPNNDGSFWAINNIGFWATNDCPVELRLSNDFADGSDPMTFGALGGFEMPRTPVPLGEISFEVAGGDLSGYVEYSFATCMGCEPLAVIEPTADPDFVTRTVTIPGNLHTAEIQARCLALVCPEVPDLRMRNFKFKLIDDTPPVIAEPFVRTPDDRFGHNGIGWVSDGNINLGINVGDEGVGIAEATLRIDGELIARSGYCLLGALNRTSLAFPCPEGSPLGGEIDLSSYTNGSHTLEIDAVDGLGNAAETYTEEFFVDNTPPLQPEKPRIVNPLGFEGWSHEAEFEVEFDDPWHFPANYDGADFRDLYEDVQPLSGQALDPPARTRWPYWGSKKVQVPGEGLWRVWYWYSDEAGNRSNRAHIDLGLDFDQPRAPSLTKNDWISSETLMAGYDQTWMHNAQPAELESGVCGFAFDVDDVIGAVPDIEIDRPAEATSAEISRRIGSGRHFSHLRAVGCNGLASDVDTVQLNVDGKAPDVAGFPPQSDEWKSTPTELTISGADDLSGVARIHYRFPGELAKTINATRIDVPMPEGEQAVEYWAVDRAGNESERRTTTVRTDTTSPTVTFAPRSNLKPATLTAEAMDAGSGLASAWLEVTEAGRTAWRQLGPTESPNASSHAFSRDIPEDLGLVGAHSFRVVAIDQAGNRAVGTAGAGAVTLDLPLKSATALSVGLAPILDRCRTDAGESCRSTTKCPRGKTCQRVKVIDRQSASSFRRTRFGDPLAIVGTLSAADGSPLASRAVEIVALPRFGVERVVDTVLTDQTGAFELQLPTEASAFYTARFAGDDFHSAQRQTVESSVRAKVTFRVSRKRVRANQILRFSGRVYGAPEYAANGGKIVTIQFLRGRRWINTASSAQTGPGGRFSTTFSLPVVAKRSPVYFHAKVIPDGNWPFEVASSKAIRVVFIP